MKTVGSLKVTEAEYRQAHELSSDANTPEHEASEYWQIVRYYRGEIFNRSEVESALARIRKS